MDARKDETRPRSPSRDVASSRQDRSPTTTRWRDGVAPTSQRERPRDRDRENIHPDAKRDAWSVEDGRSGRRRRGEEDSLREREKEKEPAWMGDYDEPNEKILGRSKDGEMDGIQAGV